MAKKTVATLQEAKNLTKCIKMVKSAKTGKYVFEEKMLVKDKTDKFFQKK